jgi:hypothetical protein
METRATFHGSAISKSLAAAVVAVLAAFLLGGVGGYFVKALSLPGVTSATETAIDNPPLKTANQLPGWVQKYNSPAEEPRFKVDELIRSLDYAPVVRAADLPAWLQQLMTPAVAPRFKVDDYIGAMNFGLAALEPGSAWNYSTRQHGTQSVEGPASAELPAKPSFREPGSRRSGPQT